MAPRFDPVGFLLLLTWPFIVVTALTLGFIHTILVWLVPALEPFFPSIFPDTRTKASEPVESTPDGAESISAAAAGDGEAAPSAADLDEDEEEEESAADTDSRPVLLAKISMSGRAVKKGIRAATMPITSAFSSSKPFDASEGAAGPLDGTSDTISNSNGGDASEDSTADPNQALETTRKTARPSMTMHKSIKSVASLFQLNSKPSIISVKNKDEADETSSISSTSTSSSHLSRMAMPSPKDSMRDFRDPNDLPRDGDWMMRRHDSVTLALHRAHARTDSYDSFESTSTGQSGGRLSAFRRLRSKIPSRVRAFKPLARRPKFNIRIIPPTPILGWGKSNSEEVKTEFRHPFSSLGFGGKNSRAKKTVRTRHERMDMMMLEIQEGEEGLGEDGMVYGMGNISGRTRTRREMELERMILSDSPIPMGL